MIDTPLDQPVETGGNHAPQKRLKGGAGMQYTAAFTGKWKNKAHQQECAQPYQEHGFHAGLPSELPDPDDCQREQQNLALYRQQGHQVAPHRLQPDSEDAADTRVPPCGEIQAIGRVLKHLVVIGQP